MRYILGKIVLLALSGLLVAASTVDRPVEEYSVKTLTIKKGVDVRKGPGTYYPLLVRTQQSVKASRISAKQQWIKVELPDQNGWVPGKAIARPSNEAKQEQKQQEGGLEQQMQNAFNQLNGGEEDTSNSAYASPAQIAGAVKGFAEKFTKQKTGKEKVELDSKFRTLIKPGDFTRFQHKRFANWSWKQAQERFYIRADTVDLLSSEMDKLGWGVANVIASKGLLNNIELRDYLTMIAMSVIEVSHRYETPLHLYILDSSEITGYACPNGTIFVTKGALQQIRSEAEFAYYIAHEWAHVVFSHGQKETQKRKEKIKAQQAFAEMDKELEEKKKKDKYDKVEKELTDWANQVYEYIISDRLNKYEYQADKWGIIYTYRAGYNPRAGIQLLERVERLRDQPDDPTKLAWHGTPIDKRIQRIRGQIQQLNIPGGYGQDYQTAFQKKIRRLADW